MLRYIELPGYTQGFIGLLIFSFLATLFYTSNQYIYLTSALCYFSCQNICDFCSFTQFLLDLLLDLCFSSSILILATLVIIYLSFCMYFYLTEWERERESLVTMNVHACVHVHGLRWMRGVHGQSASILQKKCWSNSLKAVENSLVRDNLSFPFLASFAGCVYSCCRNVYSSKSTNSFFHPFGLCRYEDLKVLKSTTTVNNSQGRSAQCFTDRDSVCSTFAKPAQLVFVKNRNGKTNKKVAYFKSSIFQNKKKIILLGPLLQYYMWTTF